MEPSKLANGTGQTSPTGRAVTRGQVDTARPAPKKAGRKSGSPASTRRPRHKGDKSKSDQLVCRYCGSADLAPSFIQRRDRRCRKCFSKRYGSAARGRKPKVRK